MSKVIAIMSMSLDGYVADRNGSVTDVMSWYRLATMMPFPPAHRGRTFHECHP